MEFSIYNLQEVPFEKLEDYGLSRLMIQDLPENVMQRFLMGYPTPALPFSTEDNDGKKVSVYAQISLIHKDDKVDFLFYPQMESLDLSDFHNINPENIKDGMVVRSERGYSQYVAAIDQMITVPYGIVLHNVEFMQGLLGFSSQDRDNILKGKVATFEYKKSIVSLGIDLNERKCLRVSKGQEQAWVNNASYAALKKHSFGQFGCWVTDDKQHLSYIPVQEYENHEDIMDALRQQMGMSRS